MTQGEPIRELYLTRDILKQPLSSERVGGIGDYGVSPVRSYRHSGGNRKAMAGPGTYPIGIFKSVEDAVINGYLPLKTSKDIVLGTTTYPKGSKLEDLIQGSSSISKGIANTILYYDSAQNLTSSSTLQFDGSDIKLTLLQEDSSAGLLGYTNDGTIVKSTWAKTQFNTNKLFSPSGSLNIGISEGTIFFNSASSGLFALFNTLGATIQNKITVFNGASVYTFEVDNNLVLSSQVEDVLSIAPSGAITLYNYKDYISSSNINTTRFLVTEASGEIKHSSILFVDNNRVGIGTDIPEALLDVEGDAVINGTLTADTYANLYAEDIPFDNTLHVDDTHGLQSTNVQDAIDELEYKKVNVADLNTNLILFPTTFLDPVLPYYNIVSTTEDTRYDDVAQDVATAQITADDQEVAAFVSDTELIIGDVGLVNVTTIGKVRKVTGNKDAGFYFKVFKRNDAGVETEICKSDPTPSITTTVYQQFAESALFPVNTSFTYSDRVVVKWYAVLTGTGNDPIYEFQIGGTEPVRILIPVPASAVVNSLWSTDNGQEIYFNEGNVGIGTQTPSSLLEVVGNIKTNSIDVTNLTTGVDAGIVAYDADNKLLKSQLITTNGTNIGIGKANPVHKLDINGVTNTKGLYSSSVNLGFETQIAAIGTSGAYNAGYYLGSSNTSFAARIGMAVGSGDVFISAGTTSLLRTVVDFKANGTARFRDYGTGTITGTESTFPVFTASGDIVESQLITTDGTNVDIKNQLNVSGLTRRITLEGGLANAYIDANVGGNREWLNLQTVGGSYFKVNNLNSKISIETGGQPLEIIGRTAQGVTITTYTSAASVIPLRVKRHSAVALQRLQAWVDESDNILSTVDYRGWLGIGTPDPLVSLDIHNDNPAIRLNDLTSGDQHFLTSNNSEFRIQSTGFITFRPNNTPAMTILQNGNVGIGTTSPIAKLDTRGAIYLLNGYELSWHNGFGTQTGGIYSDGGGNLDFFTRAGATRDRKLSVRNNGQLLLDKYGTGAITGTESTFPAFTASGDIVESQLINNDGSTLTFLQGDAEVKIQNAGIYFRRADASGGGFPSFIDANPTNTNYLRINGRSALTLSVGSVPLVPKVHIQGSEGAVVINNNVYDSTRAFVVFPTSNGSGKVRFTAYGQGNITGSFTRILAVEADGDIIEVTANDILRSVPSYADNAAAVAGGLAPNDTYYNTTDDAYKRVK